MEDEIKQRTKRNTIGLLILVCTLIVFGVIFTKCSGTEVQDKEVEALNITNESVNNVSEVIEEPIEEPVILDETEEVEEEFINISE